MTAFHRYHACVGVCRETLTEHGGDTSLTWASLQHIVVSGLGLNGFGLVPTGFARGAGTRTL